MITHEMVSRGVAAVASEVAEFDSHAVIEWLIKNQGNDYLDDLRLRGGEAAPPRECQIGSEDIRLGITNHATAAKPLNNQISKWVKDCPGVSQINTEFESPTLWGILGKNYLWRKRI